MKKRLPFVLLIIFIADPYFYQAVKTLTTNSLLLSAYWLYDLGLVLGLILIMLSRSPSRNMPKLISWLMGLVLLSLIPKVTALPVLLLEDVTRLFRGFPPRSEWVSWLAVAVAAVPFIGLLYGLTRGRHYYKVRKKRSPLPICPRPLMALPSPNYLIFIRGALPAGMALKRVWPL